MSPAPPCAEHGLPSPRGEHTSFIRNGDITMNKYVSRGLWTVLITGGLCVLGAGVANAAESSGDDGAASGNQAIIQVNLPIDLSGNGISVIGDSSSTDSSASGSSETGSSESAPAPVEISTDGSDGLLGGNQA